MVAQQYTPYLSTPLLGHYLGQGIATCDCGNPYEERWGQCYSCKVARETMGHFFPDFFVPISFRWQKSDDPFRKLTANYKEPYGTDRQANQVLDLLYYFLDVHWQSCLLPRLDPFTWVAVVPSSKGARPKHLMHMVKGNNVLEDLRWTGNADGSLREVSRDAFACSRRIEGGVLLIDDTWTTGSKARSAAWALRLAGAAKVGILTLGRHISATSKGFDDLLKACKSRPFDWQTCALCSSL